jgi:hypothetical protein
MMTREQKCVGIVDAYSTGRYIPEFLSKYDVRCFHIQSSSEIPPIFRASFQPDQFACNLINESSIEDLVSHVRALNPTWIVPGTETGVLLADELSERLHLPTNGSLLSSARRNKHHMHEALVAARVPTMPHIYARTADEILSWWSSLGTTVVVKPPDSAGAEDVYFCDTASQILQAFEAIYGKTNALGLRNDGVVSQELLTGTEYIVNCVSLEGCHCVTDAWKCEKVRRPGENSLSALEELLPFQGRETAIIVHFAYRVLHAIGITHGPTHLELILTPSGPRLIEAAARLQGAVNVPALQAALDVTHLERMAQAIADPDAFFKAALSGYTRRQHLYRVFLLCHNAGRLASLDCMKRLESLKTHFSSAFYLKPKDYMAKTVSYLTSPGLVHLASHNKAAIRKDYAMIRSLEHAGLYDLAD